VQPLVVVTGNYSINKVSYVEARAGQRSVEHHVLKLVRKYNEGGSRAGIYVRIWNGYSGH